MVSRLQFFGALSAKGGAAYNVAIELDPETIERVKRLAEARHRSPNWVMQEAIRQYVEREARREAFLRDGTKTCQEYKLTGLHVTQEEAGGWLVKLEEGQGVEPPKCHV